MEINGLVKTAHSQAKEKGFWDKEKEIGTTLMLIVSELGEALEAHRKGHFGNLLGYDKERRASTSWNTAFENQIKDSFEDELADVVIRVADLCGKYNIDLQRHIELKLQYNKTRGYKHNKQY